MYSNRLKRLTPYIPGEQPLDRTYIKLNTNENPYPPTPKIDAFLKGFKIENLKRYPDPLFGNLREKIALRYGLKKEQIFAGNGSDEVLSFAFYAFFDSRKGRLLFPEFSYSFYPVYCDFYNIDYDKVPLKNDFSIDIQRFLSAGNSCGIIFPNPNAPTGMIVSIEDIARLLEQYDKNQIVIIDEAYIDFGGQSALHLIQKHQNLLIIRTCSKSMSLAGLRLGFAMGDQNLIKALFSVKDSFNSYPVNAITQKIGEIAMMDKSWFQATVNKIIAAREYLTIELTKLNWRVLPSKANFVFASKNGVSGKTIYSKLKDKGVLVRHFDIEGIKDFVRITIGTKHELNVLLTKIKQSNL
jgi:histidinol-phosphate aminotransferase